MVRLAVLCLSLLSFVSALSPALGFASPPSALPRSVSLRRGLCQRAGEMTDWSWRHITTKERTARKQLGSPVSADMLRHNLTVNRKQFVNLATLLLVGSSSATPAMASDKLKCKAQIGGGQRCETKEIQFQKAYDTSGSTTKVTGDPNKMETFYSQIHAGLETLEELSEKWDAYIEAGDGDVVRRRLGTVGNKSPLHNIRKAFEGALKVAAKSPIVEPDTLDELDVDFNAILQGIAEVDYNLYSTAFVGTDETASKLRADGKGSLEKSLKLYRKFDSECAKVLSN